MGLWFFLSVVVVGNWLYKAYKMRLIHGTRAIDERLNSMDLELKAIREKIQHLDEAVFFGDFDLRREFSKLEREAAAKKG